MVNCSFDIDDVTGPAWSATGSPGDEVVNPAYLGPPFVKRSTVPPARLLSFVVYPNPFPDQVVGLALELA